MDKGFVIAFEGGEGSGKSTALPIFEQLLKDAGFKVKTYGEPGGTDYAQTIRRLFFDTPDLSVKAAVHLMNSQRQDNIDNIIRPAVDDGYIVLIDRFVASTMVYQGLMSDQLGDLKDKKEQREWVTDHAITHDHVVFFFDCPPEVSLSRVADRGQDNYLDALSFDKHQTIYTGYKQILDGVVSSAAINRSDANRMVDQMETISYVPGCLGVETIDACDSVDGVTQQLQDHVDAIVEALTDESTD